MTSPTLLVRADASPTIGTGHVMRQIALAQAWRAAGGRAVFASHAAPDAIARRLIDEGFDLVTVEGGAEATAAAARRLDARFASIDGYHLTVEHQRALRHIGVRTLVADDNGEIGAYEADVVLNQNLHAREDTYVRRSAGTQLLLGPRYALLRDEFSKCAAAQRNTPDAARKLLLSMGGADPSDVTARALDALKIVRADGFAGLSAEVIVGGANPRLPRLRELAAAMNGGVEVLADVKDMPQRMARADLAISAAGSTCWELAACGLAALVTAVAPNQRRLAESLDEAGIARNLGEESSLSAEAMARALKELALDAARRAEMGRKGRALIDGRGAARVVKVLDGGAST